MGIDPTYPGRFPDNFQEIKKSLGKLGTLAGVARTLSATETLDFPSISAQTCEDLTLTVTGAETGDAVYVGAPSGLESNLTVSGFVSSADTVTVRVCNPSSSPINPASATWRVVVIGF